MNVINKINIQKIEFENNTNYANVLCVIDSMQDALSEMIIEQSVLNKLINKLQTLQNEDEVLNHMKSYAIDDDNVIYSINLAETGYQDTWIDLDFNNYQLIRA